MYISSHREQQYRTSNWALTLSARHTWKRPTPYGAEPLGSQQQKSCRRAHAAARLVENERRGAPSATARLREIVLRQCSCRAPKSVANQTLTSRSGACRMQCGAKARIAEGLDNTDSQTSDHRSACSRLPLPWRQMCSRLLRPSLPPSPRRKALRRWAKSARTLAAWPGRPPSTS